MAYYIPDLTGVDPDYKVSNDIYTLTTTGVVIEFRTPIYASSLSIVPVTDQSNPLVKGTDYSIQTSDIDYTTMARAANVNNTFTATLIKSITITRPQASLPIQVAMSYQTYYLTTPTVPISNGASTLDLTPDLVQSMLDKISTLEAQVAQVGNSAGFTSAMPTLLQEDINGTNSANVITNETWTIDTYNNKKVVFPVQGAFFKDSVVVTVNGTALTYGTDYLILGNIFPLTRVTTNTSGIFSFILITYQYAGTIDVTYHAVGGEVTTNVVGDLYNNINDIKTFLESSSLLTTSTLGDTTVIQTILSSIKELQSQMRIEYNGTATYGDTTNGTAIAKQIRATDTSVHWWTIASLYKVTTTSSTTSTTTTNFTKHDRMSLHIQLANAGYMADVDVAFDMDQTAFPCRIEARNVLQDVGFTLFGDVSLTTLVVPMFRVVWNTDDSTISGAYLQIGMTLPSLTETVTIEDRSGVESTWILDTTTGTTAAPLTPTDDAFTLPDGASTWSSSGGTSTQSVQTLQNSMGYLVYNGSTLINTFDDTAASAGTISTIASNLPAYFRLQDIKTLVVTMTDVNNRLYTTEVPVSSALSTSSAQTTGSVSLPISASYDIGILTLTLDNSSGSITIAPRIYGETVVADKLALRYIVAKI